MMAAICSVISEDFYVESIVQIGAIIYTDVNLTIPLTGYGFFEYDANGRIYTLDPSTGEILDTTTGICNGGTAALYKTGNNLSDLCGDTPTTYYTLGDFLVGDLVFTDIDMTIPLTGFDFIVTADGNIYTIDSTTGEVLDATGSSCITGAVGTYKLGDDLNTICESVNVLLYLFTNEGIKSGDIIFTDINLTIPQTGFDFIVDSTSGRIFLLDPSTGLVGDELALNCNGTDNGGGGTTEEPATMAMINMPSGYNRITRMVVIDARATELPAKATATDVDAKVDEIDSMVGGFVLYYKLETIAGATIAGFYLLDARTADVVKKVIRPAFQSQLASIDAQINLFIKSGNYLADVLATIN
jgi:hypothetical protein